MPNSMYKIYTCIKCMCINIINTCKKYTVVISHLAVTDIGCYYRKELKSRQITLHDLFNNSGAVTFSHEL